MKFIEELMQGETVQWKPLGEVATLKRGRVISKEYLEENSGGYPVYSSQTSNNGKIGEINTFDFNQEAITWTTDGANAGTVFYRNGMFSITNVCGLITIKDTNLICYKYLYYYLSTEAHKHVYSGMGNPKLMSNQVAKILIPIPPLRVQRKIVEVLDKFSELTAELTARQKQYEYYRNKLLSFAGFAGAITYKPLGEVCEYEQPTKYLVASSAYKENSPTPVLTAGKTFILGYTDEQEGIYPASISPVIIFDDFTTDNKWVDFDFKIKSSAMKLITIKDESVVLLKYIYYWLNTLPSEAKEQGLKRQWISNFSKKLIPIPPLEEQRRIVDILDKFDTLVNSLTEGLPREIELRQKQYEYYRNALLSFTPPAPGN